MQKNNLINRIVFEFFPANFQKLVSRKTCVKFSIPKNKREKYFCKLTAVSR